MASAFGKSIGEYRKASVTSASPLQLVIMLYDGALRCCESAKRAMASADLERQHKELTNAQRIVSELISSLDMAQGGEIAQNLFALYSFCLNELTTANVQDRPESVEAVMKVLSELRIGWQHVQTQVAGEAHDGA